MNLKHSVNFCQNARSKQDTILHQITSLKSFAEQIHDKALAEILKKEIAITEETWKSNEDRLKRVENLIIDVAKLSSNGTC